MPGIVIAFLAGGASVLSRNEDLDPLLAVPFGAGVALTLDESALLLRLDDVYWSEDGIISVQITLAALALLSSATLVRRGLRRGERRLRLQRPPKDISMYRSDYAAAASCGRASCIQMTWSRPGPTPTRMTGTLTCSAMKAR